MIRDIKKNLKANIIPLSFSVGVFIIVLIYYLAIFSRNTPTDMQLHADMAIRMKRGEFFIGNFLFFFLVILFSLGSSIFKTALLATIFLVTFAVALKYYYTQKYLLKYMSVLQFTKSIKNLNIYYFAGLLSIILIFCSVINLPTYTFTKNFIIGQFPPNGWHNSTSIFLMPFALLLFFKSYEMYNQYTQRKMLHVILLVLINALIKPSFLFCFILVFPLLILVKYKFSKIFFKMMLPVIFSFVVILLQYIITFYYQKKFNISENSGIKIDPFNVWTVMTDSYIISLFISIAYPISFVFFYFKKAINDILFQYSLGLFSSAILVFIFLSETGAREFHGNFIWQVIICNYLLFTTTLITHIRLIFNNNKFNWRDKIIFVFLGLHFMGGLFYLGKFLVFKDFH